MKISVIGQERNFLPAARDACRRQTTICVPAHSKTPEGATSGGLACVKGEFFGIAIADLTSVIKSVINIPCFPLRVYNYITKE